MSPTRAKYITAKKAYDSACEQEKLERQADGYPQRLRMAEHFTSCCQRDLESAKSDYWRECREDLVGKNPEFKRLVERADAATVAYYEVRGTIYELRKVLTSMMGGQLGDKVAHLDGAAREAYSRTRVTVKSAALMQLDALKEQLDKLRDAHEEASAVAFTYLEAAIDQAELAAAAAAEGRAA